MTDRIARLEKGQDRANSRRDGQATAFRRPCPVFVPVLSIFGPPSFASPTFSVASSATDRPRSDGAVLPATSLDAIGQLGGRSKIPVHGNQSLASWCYGWRLAGPYAPHSS